MKKTLRLVALLTLAVVALGGERYIVELTEEPEAEVVASGRKTEDEQP